ncbi:uncharacterized protein L201_007154 [Kwoniella dendrophila CBS 6074]|uniref:Uncharacterized protein n=1 Tax=Kwoniella dendrophila CBS 6074 TaxID=1295534 RepID=A0AAX4K3K4_9TREE
MDLSDNDNDSRSEHTAVTLFKPEFYADNAGNVSQDTVRQSSDAGSAFLGLPVIYSPQFGDDSAIAETPSANSKGWANALMPQNPIFRNDIDEFAFQFQEDSNDFDQSGTAVEIDQLTKNITSTSLPEFQSIEEFTACKKCISSGSSCEPRVITTRDENSNVLSAFVAKCVRCKRHHSACTHAPDDLKIEYTGKYSLIAAPDLGHKSTAAVRVYGSEREKTEAESKASALTVKSGLDQSGKSRRSSTRKN